MEDTKKEKLDHPYPQVRFAVNEELNAEILNQFILRKTNRGGANFNEIVIKYHPGLAGYDELNPDERLKKVKAYVHGYYQEHLDELDKAARDVERGWADYAPHFFVEAGKIFKEADWPDGKYIGYILISPPYPRFIDSKTFGAPYQSVDGALRTSAHEMLHIIFYDYVRKRYLSDMDNTIQGDMAQRLEGKFTIPLWELSEIFNIVVLSSDEWGKGTRKQHASSYPHLVQHVPGFEKLWEDCGHDIDELFTRLEIKDTKEQTTI